MRDERLALPPGFDCSQAAPALFTDLAHSAPLGMTLGSGPYFPPEYQDDLFIAYHGSWNASLANARDAIVRRIVAENRTAGSPRIENGLPVRAEGFANG